MVVIDLWNAGEQRPVETLSGGESFLVSLSLALALLRTKQRALKAGIIVFGRGLWHTGQRDPGCRLKRTGKPAVIWQDHWCYQPYRPAYPAHTCEDRCEKDRGRDFNYTCEGVGLKGLYAGGCPVCPSGWEVNHFQVKICWLPVRPGEEEQGP